MHVRGNWWVLQDEAGEGGEGGGGGGGGGSGIDINMLATQVDLLAKGVNALVADQTSVKEALAQLPKTLAEMNRPPEDEGNKGGGFGKAENLFGDLDLEQLDRTQFGTVRLTKFMENLDKHMGARLKPLEDKLGQVETTVTSDLGRRQVDELQTEAKDLMEWKDELAATLKENPSLTLKRAYTIVRAENPDKASKLDAKASNGKDAGDVFLGLTPTSRSTGSDGKGGRMKFHEAAQRAFDDTLTAFGGGSFDSAASGSSRRR